MFDNYLPLNSWLALCFRLLIVGIVGVGLFIYLKGKHSGYILLTGLIVAYIIAYFVGREYLQEGFYQTTTTTPTTTPNLSDTARGTEEIVTRNDTQLDTASVPYNNKRIESVDDYEYTSVFDNETDKELTKDLRTKLMSQYPMDWSTQPESSTHFQNGLHDVSENSPYDVSGANMSFNDIGSSNVEPIDTDDVEIKERKMLQTYVPKKTSDLKTYDVDDAYGLIKQMYTAKGLVPEVTHKKDTNIYEITGVRKMGEKVQYEDEVDAPREGGEESLTVVPQAARDLLNEGDPFYNRQQKTRTGKWDYTKYTPELERMFAPTYPRSQWY